MFFVGFSTTLVLVPVRLLKHVIFLSPKSWRLNSTKIGRYENRVLIEDRGYSDFYTPLYANLFTNTHYRYYAGARVPIDAGNLVADTGTVDDYRYYFRLHTGAFATPYTGWLGTAGQKFTRQPLVEFPTIFNSYCYELTDGME